MDPTTVRRLSLAAITVGTGVVHLALAPHHIIEAPWLGALFILDGIALCLVGAWLAFRGTQGAWRAAAAVSALTVVAYAVSRIVGLPFAHKEAWDALGVVTTGAELLIVGAAAPHAGARMRLRLLVPAIAVVSLLTGVAYAAGPPRAEEAHVHVHRPAPIHQPESHTSHADFGQPTG